MNPRYFRIVLLNKIDESLPPLRNDVHLTTSQLIELRKDIEAVIGDALAEAPDREQYGRKQAVDVGMVCPECGGPADDRVKEGMKCGRCAYGA